jgi:hypothetical protein
LRMKGADRPGVTARAGVNTHVLRNDAGGTECVPPAVTLFCEWVHTGIYAVTRTGPATQTVGLAPRLFWNSTSCASAISIA